jgi:hypothetical protein
MTSSLIDKITTKSKNMLFDSSRSYKSQGPSCVPYEEVIVTHHAYPDTYFLVHKNMLFNRGTVCDTSYSVYSFDKEGEFIKQEEDKPVSFFRDMEVINTIE